MVLSDFARTMLTDFPLVVRRQAGTSKTGAGQRSCVQARPGRLRGPGRGSALRRARSGADLRPPATAAPGRPGVIPALSNDAEFFPGMPKSWAYTFMINDEDAPTGRPAGSLAWAGLANLYYWIDRRNSIAGLWGTHHPPRLPQGPVGVAVPGATVASSFCRRRRPHS